MNDGDSSLNSFKTVVKISQSGRDSPWDEWFVVKWSSERLMDILGFIIICVKVLAVFAGTMLAILAMIYAERRVSAFMQGRIGPNRVGPKGLLQPLADGVKFLTKEDIIPDGVDKPIFILSPAIVLIPALMTFAVIPFGSNISLFENIP